MGKILSKPEYMGHTVNFRSHKQSYKDKNSVPNPQEEWLIFENTHEAIVDKETWETDRRFGRIEARKSDGSQFVGCDEDMGIDEVKKSVAAMERSLERLTQQEEKYVAELLGEETRL